MASTLMKMLHDVISSIRGEEKGYKNHDYSREKIHGGGGDFSISSLLVIGPASAAKKCSEMHFFYPFLGAELRCESICPCKSHFFKTLHIFYKFYVSQIYLLNTKYFKLKR